MALDQDGSVATALLRLLPFTEASGLIGFDPAHEHNEALLRRPRRRVGLVPIHGREPRQHALVEGWECRGGFNHLKGLLPCGTYGSRMLLDFATNPRGVTYAYFVCSGRAAQKTGCTRRAVPVAVAERLVADSYASVTISDATYRDLAAKVDAAFDSTIIREAPEHSDDGGKEAKRTLNIF